MTLRRQKKVIAITQNLQEQRKGAPPTEAAVARALRESRPCHGKRRGPS